MQNWLRSNPRFVNVLLFGPRWSNERKREMERARRRCRYVSGDAVARGMEALGDSLLDGTPGAIFSLSSQRCCKLEEERVTECQIFTQ